MPPFIPLQKNRKPGDGEKVCPKCDGTGSVNTHACPVCHHSGVVPKDWKQGDGPVPPGATGKRPLPAGGGSDT